MAIRRRTFCLRPSGPPGRAAAPALLLAALLPAQEAAGPAREGPLSWPRDAERPIARVGSRALTLADLVDHVVARHDPHFERFLATPEGNRALSETRFGADWVRQYADVVALEREARRRGLRLEAADPVLGEALEAGFEPWLERQVLPAEMTQERMNFFLARFQRWFGLQTEVQGWLDFLVPAETDTEVLRAYFTANPRVFGGGVTFAHLLVHHRDPQTLRLLGRDARQEAWDRIADARARLEEDGGNFEELAGELSDDRRTAARGGILEHVGRFDPALPAVLVRTAWSLADGEVSEPVESPYGIHLVKRKELTQRKFILFTEDAEPLISETMREHRQENLLFAVRARENVHLLY